MHVRSRHAVLYWILSCLFVHSVIGGSGSLAVRADESAIPPIPADVDMVIVVKSPFEVAGRFGAYADNVIFGWGESAQRAVLGTLDALLVGRTVRGLQEGGQITIAVDNARGIGSEFPWLVIADVTNYEAFRDSLGGSADEPGVELESLDGGVDRVSRGGSTVFFARWGEGRAVAARSEEAVRSLIKGDLPTVELTKGQVRVIRAADIAAYVDVGRIWDRFKQEIALVQQQFDMQMALVAAQMQSDAFEQQLAIMRAIFRLPDYVRNVVVGASVKPEQIVLEEVLVPVEGSALASLLGGHRDRRGSRIGRLPAGQHVYFEAAGLEGILSELGAQWLRSIWGSSKLDESVVREANEALQAAGVRLQASTFSLDPAGGVRQVSVVVADKPAELRKRSVAMWKRFAESEELKRKSFVKSLTIKENALTYRGITFDRIEVRWDLDALVNRVAVAQPQAAEATRAFLGEGTVLYQGIYEDAFLLVMSPDEGYFRKVIDAYIAGEGAAGNSKEFVEALKSAAKSSQLIGLLNMGDYLKVGLQQVIPGVVKPDVQLPTAYVVLSFTSSRRDLEARQVVPARAVQAVVDLFMTFAFADAANVE